MDVTQALKNAENSLRDFIAYVLHKQFGNSWEENCGVSPERLEKWKVRKEIERQRQSSGLVDERLIYYSDFYDLKTILKKQWHHFSNAFGDLKTFEVWLTELEKMRDPDAHRRELLPHQKNLILGVSGEIRSKIVRYRSSLETSESYYSKIEFCADNLGNSWKLGQNDWVSTRLKLRPGDFLEHIVTATDPLQDTLFYQFTYNQGEPSHSEVWEIKNTSCYEIAKSDVGKLFFVYIKVKSNREYLARGKFDDGLMFTYEVLPPK